MLRVKKYPQRLRACRLGENAPLEQELRRRGLLRSRADGTYELFTRETAGAGQVVSPGDYVKLDTIGMPYCNDPVYFRQNHTHLEGEWYLQTSPQVLAWRLDLPMAPPIRFLTETGRLQIRPEDPDHTFTAFLWGTWQTAAADGVIILRRIVYGNDGEITDAEFHMVAGDEFRKTYEILP